ncbi:MAG: NAD(P)-dependent oxidoreductase [Acidimicrobiia bacterium]|nr:NAD(P)-dependent oxidoreductase [Acidimicrobiia bacterium]
MSTKVPRTRRAVVTGASGFIGSRLVHALRRDGWTVLTVSLATAGTASQLSRRLAQFGPGVVFHLGGPTGDDADVVPAVLETTERLLAAVARLTVRPRLVIMSSSAVYGDRGPRVAITEDMPSRPHSYYAVSKILLEALAGRAAIAHALDVVVARPFNVFGPGQPSHRVPAAFAAKLAAVAEGHATRLNVRNLDAYRDFVDVRDVVSALRVLAERGRSGTVYNISSGRAVRLRSALTTLVRRAGLRPEVIEHPDGEVRGQVGHAGRLRALGWRPVVSLRQSLDDLYAEHLPQ